MDSTDQAIVACARGWIGTRFHHQGRLKKSAQHKGGVDCLGLLIGVARELELRAANGSRLADADERDYSHQPDHQRLQAKLAALLRPVAAADIAPGNIVLMSVQESPQHLAIISDRGQGLGMIHAFAPAKAVVEHGLDAQWLNAIEAAYRI